MIDTIHIYKADQLKKFPHKFQRITNSEYFVVAVFFMHCWCLHFYFFYFGVFDLSMAPTYPCSMNMPFRKGYENAIIRSMCI